MSSPSSNRSDWKHLHLWQIQPVRDGLVLAAAFGLVWLGYKLSLVTVPILLALTLAYLFEPLVRLATRSGRMTRPFVAIVIIVASTLIVVVPVTVGGAFAIVQGARVAQRVVRNVDTLTYSITHANDDAARERVAVTGRSWLRLRDYMVEQEQRLKAWKDAKTQGDQGAAPAPPAPGNTPGAPDPTPGEPTPPGDDTAENADTLPTVPIEPPADVQEPSDLYRLIQMGAQWARDNAAAVGKSALNVSGGVAGAAVSTASSIGGFAFGAFLTAFFFFFFSTGYGKVLAFWESLIPEKKKGRTIDLLAQMDRVIAGFVRGRLTICAVMVVVYSLGFWLIGVPAPLIVGPIIGLLTIVPYAAGAVGIPLAMLLMWIEPASGWQGQWWWVILGPCLVTGIVQVLDDYVLTPRVQGKSTNMDTPTILFASIAGGALAGFYGILLAIPVAACIKILIKELVWPRFVAWSQGRARDVLPIGKE